MARAGTTVVRDETRVCSGPVLTTLKPSASVGAHAGWLGPCESVVRRLRRAASAMVKGSLARLALPSRGKCPHAGGRVNTPTRREAAPRPHRLGVWVGRAQVKANREAPTLDLTKTEDITKPSTAGWNATFKPQTDMEVEVAAMLAAGGAGSARAVQVREREQGTRCCQTPRYGPTQPAARQAYQICLPSAGERAPEEAC
jgi:hypothetical protein